MLIGSKKLFPKKINCDQYRPIFVPILKSKFSLLFLFSTYFRWGWIELAYYDDYIAGEIVNRYPYE